MNFRIADTFTASLAKLTGDEQKSVKTIDCYLQVNPAIRASVSTISTRPKRELRGRNGLKLTAG